MTNRFLLGAIASATTSLLCSHTLAQAGDPPAPARVAAASTAGPAEGGLQSVVVTAQRRAESSQDVGIALTPLSGDELERRGVLGILPLQYAVPNLEIDPQYGSDNVVFRIRGVGLTDYGSNNAATVGVYLDEVAYPFPVQTQGLLFDLERVEVLRGPQGTLYGRNSTGGAVNLISRRPTAEFEAGISGSWGSHDAKTAQGHLSGPLAAGLRGRLAFATEQGGAWQHNRLSGEKLGDKDTLALRGQLEYDASRTLSLRLSLRHAVDRSDSRGPRLYLGLVPNARGTPYSPAIAAERDPTATGWRLRPSFAALTGLGAGDRPHKDNLADGASLTVNWDLGATRLTSISAWEALRRKEFIDWDGSVIPQSDEVFDSRIHVASQELRLASAGKQRLNWIVGAYYANERLDEKFYSDFTGNLGYVTLTKYGQSAKTLAGFGQVDWRFDDRLALVAGLRQESEMRRLIQFSSGFLEHFTPALVGTTFFPPADRELKSDQSSGRLALEYRFAPANLAYASLSRGVKSGGFTAANSPNPYQIDPFRPEKLTAYEVGLKSDVTRSLRINGAAFFYDYRDQQVRDQVWISQTVGNVGRHVNAPRSEIQGAELELDWQPSKALQLTQYLCYKKGSYKEFFGLDAAATRAVGFAYPVYKDFAGTEIAGIPRRSYGGSLRYSWTVAGQRLSATGDYALHDEIPNSDPLRVTKRYWLANARLEWQPEGAPWTVALWVRNLFDRQYDLHHGSFLSNAQIATSGQPRSAGLQASYRF